MPNIGKEVRITTITSASLPAKKRILTVCVKLFLEQGYKKTTVAEIVHKAAVSNSIFQNIFRAKDGVLTELAEFMFSNQFSMAWDVTGKQLPPAYSDRNRPWWSHRCCLSWPGSGRRRRCWTPRRSHTRGRLR